MHILRHGAAGGEQHYAVAGYLTAYEYYAYGREVNISGLRIQLIFCIDPD